MIGLARGRIDRFCAIRGRRRSSVPALEPKSCANGPIFARFSGTSKQDRSASRGRTCGLMRRSQPPQPIPLTVVCFTSDAAVSRNPNHASYDKHVSALPHLLALRAGGRSISRENIQRSGPSPSGFARFAINLPQIFWRDQAGPRKRRDLS